MQECPIKTRSTPNLLFAYFMSDVASASEISASTEQWCFDTKLLAGRNILLVEDEALVGYELQLLLEDVGSVPLGPVPSLIEGFQFLRRERVDGAILDIDLSGNDVFELANQLYAVEIPFVFHTGHGTRTDLKRAYPGTPVCQKPTEPELVLARLAEVMPSRS